MRDETLGIHDLSCWGKTEEEPESARGPDRENVVTLGSSNSCLALARCRHCVPESCIRS